MIPRFSQYLAGPGLGPQLTRAVIGSAGLRVIGMGFAFLVGVQLARGLGAQGYGIYALAMSIIALLTIPAEFGMPQLLTREVAATQAANNWGRMRGVLYWARRSAWLFSAVITVGVLLSLLMMSQLFTQPLSLTLLVGVLMVPVVALGRQMGATLMGLHHIVKGQMPDTVVRPAAFSLLLLLVHAYAVPLQPELAMMLGVLSATTALLAAYAFFRRVLPAEARNAQMELDARSWRASALPMALTEGMRGLQGNIAILVMGALATVEAVGVFRVAVSVSVVVSIPVTLFILVGSPMISRLHTQGDKARLQRLMSWLATGMTAGSVLLTFPFLVAGESLLGRLFGAEFSASNTPLLILCLGGVLFSAQGPNIILLNMTGHEKRVTRAFLVSVAAVVLLAWPLVHFFAASGAAWASVTGLLLGNWMMWRDARKLLAVDPSILSLLRFKASPDV